MLLRAITDNIKRMKQKKSPPHFWKYCEKVLPKVSRTFALNIRVLKGELYQSILLVYLTCRIIDTIEDSPSLSPQLKIQLLKQFPEVIQSDPGSLDAWVDQFLSQSLLGRPADIDLVRHTSHVLFCFRNLSLDYQRAGEKMFAIMANGMAEYIERFPSGNIALKNLNDLKKYCYYVAGVVGEFLYESFILTYDMASHKKKILKEHCISFGLGLQMTNIAKDILRDHQRNQRFLPESFLQEVGLTKHQFLTGEDPRMQKAYTKLLKEAYSHLLKGYLFTKTIHRHHIRLRLFCIRPLWMAFETLKTLHAHPHLLHSNEDVKMNRYQVRKILFSSHFMAYSNRLIERNFVNYYNNLL